MPAPGVTDQLPVVYHQGMIFKQINKCGIEQLKVFLITETIKPVIPLNARGQRASGNIRGAYIYFPHIVIVKYVGFRMKGTPLIVIKPQIYPAAQFFLDQIQRRRLRDAKIIPGKDPHRYRGPAPP